MFYIQFEFSRRGKGMFPSSWPLTPKYIDVVLYPPSLCEVCLLVKIFLATLLQIKMDRTCQYDLDLFNPKSIPILLNFHLCMKYKVCRLKFFELLQPSVAKYFSMTPTFGPQNLVHHLCKKSRVTTKCEHTDSLLNSVTKLVIFCKMKIPLLYFKFWNLEFKSQNESRVFAKCIFHYFIQKRERLFWGFEYGFKIN